MRSGASGTCIPNMLGFSLGCLHTDLGRPARGRNGSLSAQHKLGAQGSPQGASLARTEENTCQSGWQRMAAVIFQSRLIRSASAKPPHVLCDGRPHPGHTFFHIWPISADVVRPPNSESGNPMIHCFQSKLYYVFLNICLHFYACTCVHL